jgi:hypothetical protein
MPKEYVVVLDRVDAVSVTVYADTEDEAIDRALDEWVANVEPDVVKVMEV